MPAAEKGTLPFPSATTRGLPGEAELVMLESVVRPLVANGFEFRGGDVFGQEIVSIYINDNLDEFVMLRFNRPAVEDRLAAAASYLGVGSSFGAFYDLALGLRSEMNIPEKLRELGVGDNRIDELAAMAIVDPTAGGNPVELTLDAAKELFREVI